jgi:hypothetical protein
MGMNKTTFLGDKPINRIGFGAMQLAGPGVFGPPRDPDAARAVLRRTHSTVAASTGGVTLCRWGCSPRRNF